MLNQGRVYSLFADVHDAMRHPPKLSLGRGRAAALVGARNKLSVWLRRIDGSTGLGRRVAQLSIGLKRDVLVTLKEDVQLGFDWRDGRSTG